MLSPRSSLSAPTVDDVYAARRRIAPYVLRTPLIPLASSSPRKRIYIKCENLQPYGSFKIRAAFNAIMSADAHDLKRGVVTASAGNFGQGLAAAAKALGVKVTALVPDTAATTKVKALERLGVNIVPLAFAEWWKVIESRVVDPKFGHFVHACADPFVVAGNATIALEIIEDLPDVDAVLVPVGGGGLIGGIGSAFRALKPNVKIVACESEASEAVALALKEGRPVRVSHRPTFIDGMGAPVVLDSMWPLLRQVVDGTARVSLRDVADAIRFLAASHHLIAEGAGAAPLAAALSGQVGDGKVVAVVSGGNLDARHLQTILDGGVPE